MWGNIPSLVIHNRTLQSRHGYSRTLLRKMTMVGVVFIWRRCVKIVARIAAVFVDSRMTWQLFALYRGAIWFLCIYVGDMYGLLLHLHTVTARNTISCMCEWSDLGQYGRQAALQQWSQHFSVSSWPGRYCGVADVYFKTRAALC